MSAAMLLLTLFTLFCDSLRLMAFDRGADPFFDVLTLALLMVFMTETIISSFAQRDYFLSFFFFLDIVSAASLVLDLTFVHECLVGQESLSSASGRSGSSHDRSIEESSYARAARSGRLGTRVARILRILRLIRLARIFRLYLWCQRRIGIREQSGRATPGEDADSDLSRSESRVGRKLSDRTTCWLTTLVLTMLVVVPTLDPEDATSMSFTSSQFGVDVIDQAWSDYKHALRHASTDSSVKEFRRLWEEQVLMFVYYHNWYATCEGDESQGVDCAHDSLHKICFIGYLTKSGDAVNETVMQEEQDIRYIQELSTDIEDWDALFQGGFGIHESTRYSTGALPSEIKRRLSRPWTTLCHEKDLLVHGVSMLISSPCPWQHLRLQETVWYFPLQRRSSQEGQLVVFFDVRARVAWEAGMSMIQTAFLVLVLIFGAMLFSRDADKLVLQPIERMIKLVELIRRDPLYAFDLGYEEYKSKQHQAAKPRTKLARVFSFISGLSSGPSTSTETSTVRSGTSCARHSQISVTSKTTLETKILENVIIKLGSLLAIGFGVAGSDTIRDVLDSSNVSLDARLPGSKIEAIFGFCKINSFSEVTTVLKEKTMVFVNLVAEIVHRMVVNHLGAPNKTLGEAFLLVWRVSQYAQEHRSKIADLSVMALASIVSSVSRDSSIRRLLSHPGLLAKCGHRQVSLGFGLHLGWSIEGAIGSEFKIDASYLSSHVNLAMRIEEMTREHKVTIIMSEPLVWAASKSFAQHFRAIDHILITGMKSPIRLFSLDLDTSALYMSFKTRHLHRSSFGSFESKEYQENAAEEKLKASFQVHEQLFARHNHVQRMRSLYTLEFFQLFEKGFLNYEAGEWSVAAESFYRTRHMLRRAFMHAHWVDGPSEMLLTYMEGFRFQAPEWWAGFRIVNDQWHKEYFSPLISEESSTSSDEFHPCAALRQAARLSVQPQARPIDDLPRLLSSPDIYVGCSTELVKDGMNWTTKQAATVPPKEVIPPHARQAIRQPQNHLEDALSEDG